MAVGKSGGQAGQGLISPSIVLGHDRLTRGPNGCAEVIHHGDHEGDETKCDSQRRPAEPQ